MQTHQYQAENIDSGEGFVCRPFAGLKILRGWGAFSWQKGRREPSTGIAKNTNALSSTGKGTCVVSSFQILLIDGVQFFAGFEAYSFSRSDGYFRAGTRVASNSSLSGPYVKDAETAQFNAVSRCQGFLQALKDCVYGRFRFVSWKASLLDHVMYDVLFNQRICLNLMHLDRYQAKSLGRC
jgi:hypothetical protein